MTEVTLQPLPMIQPLGDNGLLVRFADSLSDEANRSALAFAGAASAAAIPGVVEIVPNLVSVLLRYDPANISFDHLAGEVRLLASIDQAFVGGAEHLVDIDYDGEDLAEVCETLGLDRAGFIAAHRAAALRVLAIGFAPGFAYCGFHDEAMAVPRREQVRPSVAAGSVLFAARQTAIAATTIPTGWHIIGHTALRNFDPEANPPTRLRAGDTIQFGQGK